MSSGKFAWDILDRERGILTRKYHFGSGLAMSLAFRGEGDNMIVVSPPCHLEARDMDELKEFGNVTALVANNGFHWMGQESWRKHFPDAKSYAPTGSHDRIAKKVPNLPRFESLEALKPLLGARASVSVPEGYKPGMPDTFVEVEATTGKVWFPADMLANIPVLPKNLVFRTLMSMTKSAPGYSLFRPAVWVGVKDKKAARDWIAKEVERIAPITVVPAHGEVYSGVDIVETTKALVAKM